MRAKNFVLITSIMVLSICTVVQASNIRLSWEDDPKTTMTVSWQSADKGEKLKYGPTEKLGTEITPKTEGLPGLPQVKNLRKSSAFMNEAKITGLKAGTKYFYSAGKDDQNVYSFTTAPEGNEDFTFIAGADTAGSDCPCGKDGTKVLSKLLDMASDFKPRFLLYFGDAIAPATDAADWDSWLKCIQKFAVSSPVMPTPGNHDFDKDDEGTNYQARFALPKNNGNELNYSFDYGNVHFASVLNNMSKMSRSKIASSAAWLEKDLKATDKKWKIVYSHVPIMSSGDHGADEVVSKYISPILDKYNVAIYFDGHDHGYERSKPVNLSKSKEAAQKSYADGTCYMVSGGLGSPFYSFDEDWWYIGKVVQNQHFYIKVDVTEAALKVKAINTEGVAIDEFSIEK